MGVNEKISGNSTKLTLELFQEIFEKYEPGITIDSYQEARGTGKGDNYTATLFRIQLFGHRKTPADGKKLKWEKSVICKRLPDNIIRREAFKSVQLFRNEVEFYTTILPELIKFQQSKNNEKFKAIPQYYLAKNDLVILEDLLIRGFRMPDRQKGLSLEETRAVLKEIAKLHSLSLAYKFQHPKQFEKLKNLITEGIFSNSNEDWYKNYYVQLTKNAVDMVSEILPKNSKYVQRLTDFVESSTFFSRMIELVTKESVLSVICHGDCWTNNILFRYNEDGNVIETVLVDFQCIRYGSPALDLSNLIFCCTTKAMRDEYLQSFIKLYTQELYNNIKALGKLPEICDTEEKCEELIKAELKYYGKFGLGLAVDMIPISTCSSEDAPDLYLYLNRSEDPTGAPQLNLPPNDLCRQKLSEVVIDIVDGEML